MTRLLVVTLVVIAAVATTANVCEHNGVSEALEYPICTEIDGTRNVTKKCTCGARDQVSTGPSGPEQNVVVDVGKFCFVVMKPPMLEGPTREVTDIRGFQSDAKKPACTGVKADGTTAAGGNGCYCGNSVTIRANGNHQKELESSTKPTEFCDTTDKDSYGKFGHVRSSAKCTGVDGKTKATAACHCGWKYGGQRCAKDEYCFIASTGSGATSAAEQLACTGVDGKTAATAKCWCGKKYLLRTVNVGEYCFVHANGGGHMSTSASSACTGVDGKTAATADCYCGTSKYFNEIRSVGKDRYCFVNTAGKGVQFVDAQPACTGVNGKTKATAARCSCGKQSMSDQELSVAVDEYCFIDAKGEGHSSTVEKPVCASTDGSTKAGGTEGCWCGTKGHTVGKDEFCDTAWDVVGTRLSTKKCTGVDGKTKAIATCSCGSSNVQVAKDKYCFVADATSSGYESTAAKSACPSTDGSKAAEADCYCGPAGKPTAKGQFCAPASTRLTTARCTGEDGKTNATATCSCGSNDVQVAKETYCFVDINKKGKKSTKPKMACTGNKVDGTTAVGSTTSDAGCWCGVHAAAEFCCGGYVAPVRSEIVQTATFSSLTTAQYVGDMKSVVEVGYSIGLGIYDTTQNKYKTDCSCRSSAARRSITVTFTAIASADTAVAAKAAATSMTAATLNTNMASAKGALGVSVTVPVSASLGVAKSSAKVSAPAATPASDSGLGGGAIAGIVVGGIVVAGGIGAGSYFAMSSGGSAEKEARDRVDTALASGASHIPIGNMGDTP